MGIYHYKGKVFEHSGFLQPFATSHSHGTKLPSLSARDELGQDKNDVISIIEYITNSQRPALQLA